MPEMLATKLLEAMKLPGLALRRCFLLAEVAHSLQQLFVGWLKLFGVLEAVIEIIDDSLAGVHRAVKLGQGSDAGFLKDDVLQAFQRTYCFSRLGPCSSQSAFRISGYDYLLYVLMKAPRPKPRCPRC